MYHRIILLINLYNLLWWNLIFFQIYSIFQSVGSTYFINEWTDVAVLLPLKKVVLYSYILGDLVFSVTKIF